MQTARGEWLVGAEPARPAPRSAARRVSRRQAKERAALVAVLALGLACASVLGAAVVLAPGVYTPFF
jgi:hypothetical protein